MLSPIFEAFTEGANTRDLILAAQLLGSLRGAGTGVTDEPRTGT